VRPDWDGGNPRPNPPIFQKGLVTQDWAKKPAWQTISDAYHATPQLRPFTGAR
jgi:hypothetical protein